MSDKKGGGTAVKPDGKFSFQPPLLDSHLALSHSCISGILIANLASTCTSINNSCFVINTKNCSHTSHFDVDDKCFSSLNEVTFKKRQ